MKKHFGFTPQVEALDNRALLSVTLTNGLLEVVGATTDDTIRVTMASPTQIHVTDSGTGDDQTFDMSQVNQMLIRSRGGNDFVVVGPNVTIPAEIRAWAGDDTIRGGGGDDIILCGSGNDTCDGRGGDDTIVGQAGDDDCQGSAGNDHIFGDFQTDNGIGGNDTCDGGDGNDTVEGGAGNDICDGGTGDDTCTGGTGDDTVDGGDGENSCDGGGGNDHVSNGGGTDTGTESDFFAPFPNDTGSVEFQTGPNEGERKFEVVVQNIDLQGAPNASADVFVDGVQVGSMSLDGGGNGALKYEFDIGGTDEFPTDFPNVAAGSVVSVFIGDRQVAEGTLTTA